MPFTIEMGAPARSDPQAANVTLATEWLNTFPAIVDFPLDHDFIARDVVRVPRDQVLNHWPQRELLGDESLGNPIIRLWLSSAFIDLVSRPPESCRVWLRRVEPVLHFFRERGFLVAPMRELITEYEEKRKRVERVARIVGETPPR
jgi:hypothetical protein